MSRSLYTRLVSDCLLPLHERLKGHHTLRLKEALEQSQWQPLDALQREQQRRLREFLTEVHSINPYYSALFNSLNLHPSAFHSDDILVRIPCLTKELIRANQQAMLSRCDRMPRFMSTSGSSGRPLKFAVGIERVSHDVAAKWRATRWWSVDIGDREAVVWGSDIELGAQGLARQLRDRLLRSRLFPAKHLDERGLLALFDRLQAYRPKMIYGYPSILSLLAETARANGRSYGSQTPKVIFCTAEKLYDHQRELIESVFDAPVANGYGGRDAGFIAHQCPSGSLHISAEDIIVEILDEHGLPVPMGDPGEIVVTHMATQSFPIIRYRTGDIGRLSGKPCDCGRTLPVLADVMGRSNDLIIATDGSAIHSALIGNTVREEPAICQFQFIQHGPGSFELKTVCRESLPLEISCLSTKLSEILGHDAELKITPVAQIEAENNGKFKYIINRCNEQRPPC